ncbi:hypothetical protein GBAR_LOCUS25931, partial [Geodia barretti]
DQIEFAIEISTFGSGSSRLSRNALLDWLIVDRSNSSISSTSAIARSVSPTAPL